MDTKTITSPSATASTKAPQPLRLSWLGKLGYALMVACAVVLTLTGVVTYLKGQSPMTGWNLMAHVGAAPGFAIGLAIVSLTWSDRNRFGRAGSGFGGLTKFLFWLIILCGLVMILTGVVPMTPFFGSNGQRFLYLMHRFSGVVMAALLVLHFINLFRSKSDK